MLLHTSTRRPHRNSALQRSSLLFLYHLQHRSRLWKLRLLTARSAKLDVRSLSGNPRPPEPSSALPFSLATESFSASTTFSAPPSHWLAHSLQHHPSSLLIPGEHKTSSQLLFSNPTEHAEYHHGYTPHLSALPNDRNHGTHLPPAAFSAATKRLFHVPRMMVDYFWSRHRLWQGRLDGARKSSDVCPEDSEQRPCLPAP